MIYDNDFHSISYTERINGDKNIKVCSGNYPR